MSLLEPPRATRRRSRILEWVPLAPAHPDQILTFRQWCKLNCLSERSGRRIISGPDGPAVTQLSPKRIGITIANNAIWQKSRERG